MRRRKEGKVRDWQRKNKDKVKLANEKRSDYNHKITIQEWRDCKQYFNNTCAYCGLKLEDHYFTRLGITKNGDFHKDHVIDDGRNDLKNCIPSCKSCNCSKHETSLNNWYNKENPVFNQERYHKIYLWLRYDHKKFIKQKKIRKYTKKSA